MKTLLKLTALATSCLLVACGTPTNEPANKKITAISYNQKGPAEINLENQAEVPVLSVRSDAPIKIIGNDVIFEKDKACTSVVFAPKNLSNVDVETDKDNRWEISLDDMFECKPFPVGRVNEGVGDGIMYFGKKPDYNQVLVHNNTDTNMIVHDDVGHVLYDSHTDGKEKTIDVDHASVYLQVFSDSNDATWELGVFKK